MGQSLGNAVRPMTMPATIPRILRTGSGHIAGSINPDMGSGGNQDLPPILNSTTFNIDEPNPVSEPGVYQPDPNNLIPIGASVVLTATSPYGQENPITSWGWSGGTHYGSYFSTPAGDAPLPSQPPPQPPSLTAQTYEFIVGPTPDQYYAVDVTVNYQNGTWGESELLFQSEAPTGSLSVQQTGSQTWCTTENPGDITVLVDPQIELAFTATAGPNTGGDFAFMQIITSEFRQYTDANNNTWFMQNNITVPRPRPKLQWKLDR